MIILKEINYKSINNPDKKSIDYLWHGTNYQSAFWVAKNNKLVAKFEKHICFSSNYAFYKKKPALVGSVFIVWKLDFKKMIVDGYKFITNTQNRKTVETYEVISKDKIISNISKYVVETIIYRNDLQDTYLRFMKNINNFKKEPSLYSSGTTLISLIKELFRFEPKKVPSTYEEFEKLVINELLKRFKTLTVI